MVTGGKRILLTTIGSLGDLHPMIALGLELQRRGHSIAIAATELYRDKLLRTGFQFHPLRPLIDHDNPDLMSRIMDLKTGPAFLFRDVLMPAVRDMYTDLHEAARNADFAISGEIVFAMPLVAEKLNLPWASATLSPASFFSPHDLSVLPPAPWTRHLHNAPAWLNKPLVALGYAVTNRWAEPVAALRRELGLRPPVQPLFVDKHSPYLNLVLYSPVLAKPHPGWTKSSLQAGFVFYDKLQHDDALSSDVPQYLAAGDPPIVFTLGSAAVMNAGDFYQQSAEAASLLGRRALLLTGKNYAPYSEVFPSAACIVHQGGVGTTAQALRSGRPQLVVPWSFDQPDNAARVERLGVARTLARHKYTARNAARELAKLLAEPSYRAKSETVAVQVNSENGLAVACNAIETALLA